VPTEFPVNFRQPLHFTPKSFVPSVPAAPINGLDFVS
jgi:isoquinoline 1-oxidoreductase beta subunit